MASIFRQEAAKLTVRERELIELIGRGLQNKQIAYELHLREHGARSHQEHHA